ncbi:uncharacterized protein CDAR_45921 [Caerostris darwini]|uniref:Uncharacterized protein n=1 Tax=Caerostris darwini TaxID=1538125 RepID=A0AAV4MAV9_9ARAC|nr:uncharacterized protein CDAR_45921 [Caerostris darwini]
MRSIPGGTSYEDKYYEIRCVTEFREVLSLLSIGRGLNEGGNQSPGLECVEFIMSVYRSLGPPWNDSKEAMKLAVEIRSEHADGHVSPTGETFRGLSPRNTFRASTRRRQQQQDKHHLTVPSDHPDDMHTPSEDSGVDLPNGTIFGHGSRKGSRVSTGSRDSMSLDTKALQRKLSPSRLWRTSPRAATRRSLDAMTSLRDGNQATRMRRTTFRRHSSGGEGGHSEDRRPRHMTYEDRRWSLGSEMVAAPYGEGHLVSSIFISIA